jgi:hypothetical protein
VDIKAAQLVQKEETEGNKTKKDKAVPMVGIRETVSSQYNLCHV